MNAPKHLVVCFSAMLSIVFCASMAKGDIFGFYRGLDQQIASSSDIIVVKLWEAPPAPPDPSPAPGVFTYDATSGTISGTINGYDVSIVGVLKGNHREGTTMTLGLGSFGGSVPMDSYGFFERKPMVVPMGELAFNTEYLVFMSTPRRAINRTGNMFYVNGSGPLSRGTSETVKEAISRLSGLKY